MLAIRKRLSKKKVLSSKEKTEKVKQFQKVLQAAGINYDVVTPPSPRIRLKRCGNIALFYWKMYMQTI